MTFVFAACACLLGVITEGVMAGSGVRARFAGLRLPRGSPSLSVWIAVGLAYYGIFFVVIVRVLRVNGASRMPLLLVLLVFAANAAWNYLFFRAGTIFGALLLSFAYSVVVIVLLALLIPIDRGSAALVSLYAIYLVYANAWQWRMWRLNR